MFQNEYVSEGDIEKYRLFEKWLQRHPERRGDNIGESRPSWTVDRERNAYLMQIGGGNVARDEEPWIRFELHIDGVDFYPELLHGDGSSSINETPYRIRWEKVVRLGGSATGFSEQEVLSVLKDALIARGYDGARKQVPNTAVSFGF